MEKIQNKEDKEDKETIFNFDNIDSKLMENNHTNTFYREINIFKEFANKYFVDDKNKNLLQNYSISNGYKISNINQPDGFKAQSQIDFYFINKYPINPNNSTNQLIIFIFEIKDLSLKSFKICENFGFIEEKIKILKKDIFLSQIIFPMFNRKYSFVRINVIKFNDDDIQYKCYRYTPKNNELNIENLTSYETWENIDNKKIRKILLASKNVDLKEINLDLLKKDAYDNNLLSNLLLHFNDNSLINSTIISIDNIKKLYNNDFLNKKRKITKINGSPGSGKTVLAFLLFITEKQLLLIITNFKFFMDFKDQCQIIEIKNKNEFTLITNELKQKIIFTDKLKQFKTVVIDECQNIENDFLINISKLCYANGINLVLLSDYKQNIYAWNNLGKTTSKDKLKEKDDNLEDELSIIYKTNKNDFVFEWEKSNRINRKDLTKIDYLISNDKNILKKFKDEKEKSLLKISCIESSFEDIQEKYRKDQILYISHKNDNNYLNEYQHSGYEYDELCIYLPQNLEYNDTDCKFYYHFDKNKNNKVIDEALKCWFYSAFTRATKSIKIIANKGNKIYDYFNAKLKELES